VIERAMSERKTYDILTDYTTADATERKHSDQKVTTTLEFYDTHMCDDRAVTDVHWSPHYPELLLVAYSARGCSATGDTDTASSSSSSVTTAAATAAVVSNEPDGVVLVWSIATPARPELILHSSSAVLTARFHDFDSHLILGGLYSGQIVIWDMRANVNNNVINVSKSLQPIQRSPMQATTAHPIYSMAMEGKHTTMLYVTDTHYYM
jgi:dynein intermediate chain, cytosolic